MSVSVLLVQLPAALPELHTLQDGAFAIALIVREVFNHRRGTRRDRGAVAANRKLTETVQAIEVSIEGLRGELRGRGFLS